VREGDLCLRMKSPVIIDSRRTLRFPQEAESLESSLIHRPKQRVKLPLMGKESDWLLVESKCYSANEQCLRVVVYSGSPFVQSNQTSVRVVHSIMDLVGYVKSGSSQAEPPCLLRQPPALK
jgi:hypothetical protein